MVRWIVTMIIAVATIFATIDAVAADVIPISGDLDGDGIDIYGAFNSISATFTFNGKTVSYGLQTDLPIVGDWDNDGIDDLGMFRPQYPNPNTNSFFLDKGLTGYQAELGPYEYGNTGDIPVIGDWDGDGVDNIGVYRPSTGQFFKDIYLQMYEGAIVTNAAYTPKWLLKNNLRQKITNDETFLVFV